MGGELDRISGGLETRVCELVGPRLAIWLELLAEVCEAREGIEGLGDIGWVLRFDSIELIILGEGAPPNLPSAPEMFDMGCAAVTIKSRLDFPVLLLRRCSKGFDNGGGKTGAETSLVVPGSTCRIKTSIQLSLSLSLSAHNTCRVLIFFVCSMIKKACLKLRSSEASEGRFWRPIWAPTMTMDPR